MTRSFFFVLALACAGLAHAQPPRRVLMVGNSLSYTNNLPALVSAVARASGEPAVDVQLVATGGGTLSERWADGFVQRLMREQRWDALVLQERGGRMACVADYRAGTGDQCRQMREAHEHFVELARERHIRVLLLGTWSPEERWQWRLSRGLREVAGALRVAAVDPGPALRDLAARRPAGAVYADEQFHPSLEASLLVACALYRELYGKVPERAAIDAQISVLPASTYLYAMRTIANQSQPLPEPRRVDVPAERVAELIDVMAPR